MRQMLCRVWTKIQGVTKPLFSTFLDHIKSLIAYGRNFEQLQINMIEPAQAVANNGEQVFVVTDSAYVHCALAYYLPEITIYMPGYCEEESSQRQAVLENMEAYTEETLSSGDVWVVHSLSADDELLNDMNLIGRQPMDGRLEQTELTIYHFQQ